MKEKLQVLENGNALFVAGRSILQLVHEANEQLVVAADAHVGGAEFFTHLVDFAEIF